MKQRKVLNVFKQSDFEKPYKRWYFKSHGLKHNVNLIATKICSSYGARSDKERKPDENPLHEAHFINGIFFKPYMCAASIKQSIYVLSNFYYPALRAYPYWPLSATNVFNMYYCIWKKKIGDFLSKQYTAHVNRDEQGFDRYLAVQGWLDNIL